MHIFNVSADHPVAMLARRGSNMKTQWIDVIVKRKYSLTPTVVGLELVSSDGQQLPAYEAGAHINVELPGGFVRQYSLCGPTLDCNTYRLGILLDPQSRGGSKSAHEQLIEGQAVRICDWERSVTFVLIRWSVPYTIRLLKVYF